MKIKTIGFFVIGLVVFSACLLGSATSASSAITYDELDAAALRRAAQTQQAQAVDQFVRVYSQVLDFDEQEYGSSFNQDMLEASVVAGGVVLSYDDGSVEEREIEDRT